MHKRALSIADHRLPGSPSIVTYQQGPRTQGETSPWPLCDYIHPLLGLDGEVLTALSPKDHLHHRGVFWTWVRHEQNGNSLGDWWHPEKMHLEPGNITYSDGPVFSRFAAHHYWVSDTQSPPLRFVDEYVVCRVYAMPYDADVKMPGRCIDVEITLTALIDGLRIGGTRELNKGYGGFTIRFAKADEPRIVADGKPLAKDLNHLRAKWADWSGVFARPRSAATRAPASQADRLEAGAAQQTGSLRCGVAVFVPPEHPGFPPEWVTRFYGILNVAYPGLDMLELPKGRPLRLHYRLWIHRGDAEAGQVEAQYCAYTADWKWQVREVSSN